MLLNYTKRQAVTNEKRIPGLKCPVIPFRCINDESYSGTKGETRVSIIFNWRIEAMKSCVKIDKSDGYSCPVLPCLSAQSCLIYGVIVQQLSKFLSLKHDQ